MVFFFGDYVSLLYNKVRQEFPDTCVTYITFEWKLD